MCPYCFLAFIIATFTSSWVFFRQRVKQFIKKDNRNNAKIRKDA